MSDRATRATRLLRQLAEGDESAGDQLLPLVHGELHGLARQLMRGERRDHTLQPTALVHEVWLRLRDAELDEATDRGRFLQIAARAMRRVLVDHARAKGRAKRSGGRDQQELEGALDIALASCERDGLEVLALHEALDGLAERDAELARLVELRFFAGLTLEETASAMEVTVSQVRWSWGLARGWLRRELQVEGADD